MIDFDEVLDNRNQHLTKWEAFPENYGVPADTGIPVSYTHLTLPTTPYV